MELIQQRRQLSETSDDPVEGSAQLRTDLSKRIQRGLRRDLRRWKNAQIANRLQAFSDLRSVAMIRGNGRKSNLLSIYNQQGEEQFSRQSILDVFADFYEDLYNSRQSIDAELGSLVTDRQDLAEITSEEVERELRQMSKKKARDRSGLATEMLQLGHQALRDIIAEIFTKVLRGEHQTPKSWKKSFVTVLLKKGDPKMPDNYRPITLLSVLYKLFSRILLARLREVLEAAQCVDQAGFRKGYACDDHLHTISILCETSLEYNRTLWVCAIDFRKAFDSVEHGAIWKALLRQGVDARYVRTLADLYAGQTGCITGGGTSKDFKIKRGTKQGDPLSPALFNSVLEDVFVDLIKRWQDKGWGIPLGTGRHSLLTNLRFADDVLLTASSKHQVTSMLNDLRDAAARVGLELHTGKTKILTNSIDFKGGRVELSGGHVEILSGTAHTEYLGRRLCLNNSVDVELHGRIEKAWKKFFSWKAELCSKGFRLIDRLKLFESTVTPTFLYGSGSWTMTADRERQ
eukprot:12419592-Karenia_brevis.AAC.1